jgi:hypothetical protein
MGGKLWTAPEEECFWNYIIPHSDKRLGLDKYHNEELSWDLLAAMMQQKMGNEAKRRYTGQGLSM